MKPATRTRADALMLAGVLMAVVVVTFAAQSASSKTTVSAPTITSSPSSATSSSSASFAFTGPGGATFRCSLDGAPYAVCTSPRAYTGLGDGGHSFRVIAVKGADSSDATTYAWTVDRTPPPAPSIVTKPADPSSSTSPTFAFTDAEAGATFRCSLDGSSYVACTSPRSYSSVAQGQHSFGVQALDAAGNASGATTWAWRVDTTAPPAPVLTTKPSSPTENATNGFAWTSAESGVTFQCALENGAWASCSAPYTWVINTGNYGQHQFSVRSVDAAGNTSATTSYSFKYEKGLPSSGVPFQITGSAGGLSIGVWKPVVVTLTNPNSVSIFVSAVSMAVSADSTPGGCSSAANIELQQANVSPSHTVIVPANGQVTLPAQGSTTPQIRLKNLPTVNQDVCKSKTFGLTFSGTATN